MNLSLNEGRGMNLMSSISPANIVQDQHDPVK